MTLQEKIDQRYALVRQIEELKRQDEELVHEIACLLIESGEKQSYGSEGIGYSLFSTTRYEYGKAAYSYLESKGLLSQFVPEPKITRTKLDALLKDGSLTYTDMVEIEKWTTVEQSPYTLRKVVDKEAIVA